MASSISPISKKASSVLLSSMETYLSPENCYIKDLSLEEVPHAEYLFRREGQKPFKKNSNKNAGLIKWIATFPPPGMAAQKPGQNAASSSDTTVFMESFQGVLGAGGVKTASGKEKWRNAKTIKMDQKNKK